MKPILLLAFGLLALLAAVSAQAASSDEVYLPPSDARTVEDAESVATLGSLGEQGYVYRTVRRLRARTSRDVSHLNLEYLPPAVQAPATHYLPPIERTPIRQAQPNNEYLPPVVEIETEPPTTEPPTTTTTTTPEPTTTTTPAPIPTTTEAPIEEEEVVTVDTAILADDGYHYKKPDVVPDLGPVREYLPPLSDNVVVEATPEMEDESAVLADDGYHYRAIRRIRF